MIFRRTALLAVLLCISTSVLAVRAGDVAPAWTGEDENGQAVSFPAVIDDRPTVMVFWATWCPYCNAFMPYLGEIKKDYGEQINVLLINSKERGAGDPAAYVKALDFLHTAVMEGDLIGETYAVNFIPGLMIIAPDGTVAWRRESTDLPAGRKVAEFWDALVREQLDKML